MNSKTAKSMKNLTYILLLGGILATSTATYAQSDEYLDDAYLSKKEIEARSARAKAKAEAQRKKREEEYRLWVEQEQRLRDEYLKQRRNREIEAYNGRLSREDSLALMQDRLAQRGSRHEEEPETYGEYSRRLKRFHGDGTTIIINNPDAVYLDDEYLYSSTYNSRLYSRMIDPWFDSYYYPSYRYSWHYSPWSYRHYAFGAYYDPFYEPWYGYSSYGYYNRYWGGYYGAYYAGYYPYSWHSSYYPYYTPYYSGRYYRENSYRNGARSSANPTTYRSYPQSSYGAYESARQRIDNGQAPNYNTARYGWDGSSSAGTSYRGVGRSAFGGGTSTSRRYDADRSREQSRSISSDYSSPSNNNNSSYSTPSRSYGGGSSGGSRGRR